jgi:hypothetical protein
VGALATAWQARLSLQQQYNLTNPDVESATTVNATVLAAAETDASNRFFHRTGVTFDSTNSEHLTIGVAGVTYYLYTYRGLPKSAAAEAAREDWEKATAEFARTRGSLTWNSPQTDSLLSPSRDDAGALPYFDKNVIGGLRPRSPLVDTSDDLLPGVEGR